MKKIEAIIRPEKLEEIVDILNNMGLAGMNYSEIQGHGRQKGIKEIFRGREYEIRFIPKIKLEIVVPDSRAEEVIDIIIKKAQTGQIGDGKIFLSTVDDVIRVRTRERGETAV